MKSGVLLMRLVVTSPAQVSGIFDRRPISGTLLVIRNLYEPSDNIDHALNSVHPEMDDFKGFSK